MEEVTDQVAGDVLVGMEPEEHLCLQRLVLAKPECDCADGSDLSPVAPDWRNLWIGAFFGPSLCGYWDVPIRRFVDTKDGFAVG